jgi:maltose alpha-D-glucosyltransferase/alpha-amylase
VLIEGCSSFFPERVAPWRASLATGLRTQLESRVVPGYLATQRWAAPVGVVVAAGPAARGAGITGATLADWVLPQTDLARWLIAIFAVGSGAQAGHYFLPLTIALEDSEEARYRRLLPAALARVRQHASTGVLADATADEDFCRLLVEAVGTGRELAMQHGRLHCSPTAAYPQLRGAHSGELTVLSTVSPGSHTSVRLGDAFFLKIFRRLQPGTNPGIEIARYLTEVAHFANSVPLAGVIDYRREDGAVFTLALLQAYVPNQGNGWDYTVNHLVRFLEERVTRAPLPADQHGLYLALIRTLATRTAQLHATLAAARDPALAAQPIGAADVTAWRAAARAAATAALKMLSERAAELPQSQRAGADTLLARRAALLRSLAAAGGSVPQGLKIRCHGHYHLRQVLLRRNDFVITDFEAAPEQSVAVDRRRSSPLADVATMLRSFAYARRMALQQSSQLSLDERSRWEPQLDEWQQQTRRVFLDTYDEIARASGLYAAFAEVAPLLRLFELQAACVDLQQELLGRPDWAGVPLRTLLALTA